MPAGNARSAPSRREAACKRVQPFVVVVLMGISWAGRAVHARVVPCFGRQLVAARMASAGDGMRGVDAGCREGIGAKASSAPRIRSSHPASVCLSSPILRPCLVDDAEDFGGGLRAVERPGVPGGHGDFALRLRQVAARVGHHAVAGLVTWPAPAPVAQDGVQLHAGPRRHVLERQDDGGHTAKAS